MKKLILALCLLLLVSVGAAGEEMQTETAPPMVGPAYGTTFITPMIRPMKKASCALMPKAIITSDTASINRKLSAKIPRK